MKRSEINLDHMAVVYLLYCEVSKIVIRQTAEKRKRLRINKKYAIFHFFEFHKQTVDAIWIERPRDIADQMTVVYMLLNQNQQTLIVSSLINLFFFWRLNENYQSINKYVCPFSRNV